MPGALVPRSITPMGEAAAMMGELCTRLDAGEDPTQALIAIFKETELRLSAAVDRRIAFNRWVLGAIGEAKKAKAQWSKMLSSLNKAHERFSQDTLQIVQADPELPYKGELGRITVQSSGAAVRLVFNEKHITPDMIRHFGIGEDYIKYSINVAKVKEDLKAGVHIPWAMLTMGSHVRFRT